MINEQHTNVQLGKFTDHKWKQLILVVNVLFGLRLNEIPYLYWILTDPSLHRLILLAITITKFILCQF
jgi:hypothetical protein